MEIQFAGKLEFEDFKRAHKLQTKALKARQTTGKGRKGPPKPSILSCLLFWVMFFCMLPLAVLFLQESSFGGSNTFSVIVVVLLIIGAYGLWKWLVRKSLRQTWERLEKSQEGGNGLIAEDKIIFEATYSRTEMQWPAFIGFDLDGELMILSLNPAQCNILTRQMFYSDEDWQAALQVVTRNLPRHGQPDTPDTPAANCAACERSFPKKEMVQFGDEWVCGNCKPLFVQKLKEGAD